MSPIQHNRRSLVLCAGSRMEHQDPTAPILAPQPADPLLMDSRLARPPISGRTPHAAGEEDARRSVMRMSPAAHTAARVPGRQYVGAKEPARSCASRERRSYRGYSSSTTENGSGTKSQETRADRTGTPSAPAPRGP